MSEETRKIGLIVGRETSWPDAFIEEVNGRGAGVTAELVKLGGTFLESEPDYDVIVDRMSLDIPYYMGYLKYASLNGTYIINNPFITSTDDKFFGVALAKKLGLTTPRTVLLPNKRVEVANVPESFRNLIYPMNWQGIIDYVGVPAILKDAHTGGRRLSYRVHNVDELINRYDESDILNMIVQELVETETHIHCLVVGQEEVLALRYSLEEGVYLADQPAAKATLVQQVSEVARRISRAYSYDINLVEFVLRDGEPLLINPTNPAPALDIELLSPEYFRWSVKTIADFAIRLAKGPVSQPCLFRLD